MTLTKYIVDTKISRSEFARLIGVKPATIYRWESGHRYPRRKEMKKIMEVTGNKVKANDFLPAQGAA